MHMNDPNETFDRSEAVYYQSKDIDHEIYGILVTEFEKYITDEKLRECYHFFDTNINESLNNMVVKYEPKIKHFSKSVELRTRIYVAGCIFSIGHHGFWTEVHKRLDINLSKSQSNKWIQKDITKVKSMEGSTVFTTKKRKIRKNASLRQEVKNRQTNICKHFTYESCVGVKSSQLIREEKIIQPNECKYGEYGCDTIPRHKTERSQH